MINFLISHFYLFLAICLGVVSQLIIKWKMSSFSFTDYPTMYDKYILAFGLLTNPWIILSLMLTLLAGITWMIAMTKFEISYAYPFTILGFVLVFLFSVILFNETVNWQKIIGFTFIIIGLAISSKGM